MAFLLQRISDWLSRLSIRHRLVLYLLLGLLPIMIITIYFLSEMFRMREQQVLLGHMATALATAGEVREFVGGIVRSQEVAGLTITHETMAYDAMTEYLRSVRDAIPIFDTLWFALPSGVVVAGEPRELIGADISDHRYFREIAAGEDWTVGDLLPDYRNGALVFVVAHRAVRNGQFAGVVFSTFSPETLRRFVTVRAAPSVGYTILDSSGSIIVTTVLPIGAASDKRDRSWVPGVSEALRGEPTFAEPFRDRADGVWRMGASVPVPGVGWVVNVLQPVEAAMAPIRRAGRIDMALHALIMAGMLVVIWFVGTSLANPIRSLAGKADAVARGDFSQRMETWDRAELGILASAFNDMTAELEHLSIEERKARERVSFLADIGETLASTLDLDLILQTVTGRAVEFLGDMVIVFRLAPSGELTAIASSARDPEMLDKTKQLMAEHPPRVGFGVAGEAVKVGHTIFAPRLSEVESPDTRFYAERLGVVSAVAVPMKAHGQTIGALLIAGIATPLVEDQVPIVEELARRLGITLQNIRLYQDALQREEFQASLTELAVAVSSTLEPQVVLNTVCSRVQRLLQADGVYIWVLQEETDRLFGAAACGFKAEEFVGMTLPLTEIGASAVQALIHRKGFYVNNIPPSEDRSYFLTQKLHAQAAIFQPLISAGVPSGVMVVADTHDPNRFDDQSLERSRLLAGYAATALANARAYERERRIAETLQRCLLADVPARVDRFELACFYTPARREAAIGGDFYDFIAVGDSRCGLVIGDVSGKGLEAAIVTAMAKYVIRAYAAEDPEPVVVLRRANNTIVRYTAPDLFITLVYGLLDTRTGRFRYASAGHEPILVYRASKNETNYEVPVGMAAGIALDEEYPTSELALSAGDMLVMYTDGLTDARPPGGEFLSEDGLARFAMELAGQPAREFLRSLMDRVRDYSAGEFADDVAILAVRALPV